MFRTAAILGAGGYRVDAQATEDYDLYLRLGTQFEFANLPDCYLRYRVHPGQVSRGINPFSVDKVALMRRRRELARDLGAPPLPQLLRNLAWYGWQMMRYFRLIGRP